MGGKEPSFFEEKCSYVLGEEDWSGNQDAKGRASLFSSVGGLGERAQEVLRLAAHTNYLETFETILTARSPRSEALI